MDTAKSAGNTANLRSGLESLTVNEIAYLESYLTTDRLEKIKNILRNRRRDIIPVTYSLYDPFNIAGILRTSEALGLQEVNIIDEVKHNHCPKCCTKGCEKWLSIVRWTDYSSCAAALRSRGYKILVADMDGTPIDKLVITGPVALLAGSEHSGVPAVIRNDADQIISIPMCGFSQSMNVSVSMAILLSAILSKRGFKTNNHLPEGELNAIYQQWLIKAIPHGQELLQHYRIKAAETA